MAQIEELFDFRSVFIGNDHLRYVPTSGVVYKLVKKEGRLYNFLAQDVYSFLKKIENGPVKHVHIHIGEDEIFEHTNVDELAYSILDLARGIVCRKLCKILTIGGLICQTHPRNLPHDVEKFNKICKGVNKRLRDFCKTNPFYGYVFLSLSQSELKEDGIHLTDVNYAEYGDRIWNIAWDLYGKSYK